MISYKQECGFLISFLCSILGTLHCCPGSRHVVSFPLFLGVQIHSLAGKGSPKPFTHVKSSGKCFSYQVQKLLAKSPASHRKSAKHAPRANPHSALSTQPSTHPALTAIPVCHVKVVYSGSWRALRRSRAIPNECCIDSPACRSSSWQSKCIKVHQVQNDQDK